LRIALAGVDCRATQPIGNRSAFHETHEEVAMSETLTQSTSQLPSDAPGAFVEFNKRTMHVLFDAQKVLIGEIATASDEMLDDVRAEMHLAAEFAAKIHEAHSVANVQAALKECSQHQMDVLSRESQNILRRSQRLVHATSQLLAGANSP
jgi:hypothetical protein